MNLSEAQRYHIKKFVKELATYRALHTEFVTVYIPAGYELSKVINHLAEEQGTATNIKSAVTRKNVIDALERMIQHLKLYKATPPNGLVAFSGNIAAREGKNDVRVWSIEPPLPVNTRIYRCDKDFKLDILTDMLDVHDFFGLVVIDARDAMVALLKGKSIVPLTKTHSQVPGKFKAGGQSAMRFQQNRELAVKAHYKKVADLLKDEFLTMEGLKGIIVGGPGPTKYEFVEGGFITNEVQKKILGVKDLSYTEEFGIEELVEKSQDLLAQEGITEEKKLVGKFLETLAKKPGMVTYGFNEVLAAIDKGVVDTVLVSEAMDDDSITQLEEAAKKYSTTVFIISVETREGVQLRELGKVGAILRYELS